MIVICSGRPICDIDPRLLNLKFNGIIGAAGAYVECNAQIIYEHCMESEALINACELLEKDGALYWAQTKNGIIVTRDNKKRLLDKFHFENFKDDAVEIMFKCMQVDDELQQRQDIEKINYVDSCLPVSEFRKQLLEYCDVTEMSFGSPADNAGEISSRGINKAFGMQKFIEYIGCTREDRVAFGDGSNDFEMLEYAGIGVAMGNAIEDLKKCADYVTTGIDEMRVESNMHCGSWGY